MTHIRNCPNCNTEIEYTNKRSWYNANRKNSQCRDCQTKQTKELIKQKKKNGESWGGVRNSNKEKNLKRPFKKNCPKCGSEMGYVDRYGLNRALKENTMCNSCSTKRHKKGFVNGLSDDTIKQMRATKAGFSSWEEYVEKYPKKEMYKREVWKYTYRNDLESLPNFDKRGRNGVEGAYQIDHIISINEGWERGIPAEEIGKMENLRMITWQENRKKW